MTEHVTVGPTEPPDSGTQRLHQAMSCHGKKVEKSSQPSLYPLHTRTNYTPKEFIERRTFDLFPSLYINRYCCTWLYLMTVAVVSIWGCRLAWGHKAFGATEPDGVNLIPKTYVVERENQIPQTVLDLCPRT